MTTERSNDTVRTAVRETYGKAAEGAAVPGCCGPDPAASLQLGYAPDDLAAVPEGANLGLGCGNPQAIAALRPGETVLDLGSGGGFDCFLAGKQVGPSGRIIGVDMTPAMVTKARANAERVDARSLRPFVTRRVSSPADVEDVVQDVFLRMQRSVTDLRDEERFGPWVYRIARSAIAEYWRARARHPLATAPRAEVAEDPSEAKDDCAVEQELATYIAPFVATLSSPYREALTLTELEGLTQREAAEMMGVSVSGMKSRVQRGREQLRKLVEDCCEIALDARGRVIGCEPKPDGRRPGDCC